MSNHQNLATVNPRLVATRAIYAAAKKLSPIDPEKRKRIEEFRHEFVDLAGSPDDEYDFLYGVSPDPEDRSTILAILGDAIGTTKETDPDLARTNNDISRWAERTRKLLQNGAPKWRNDLVAYMPPVALYQLIRNYMVVLGEGEEFVI